MDVDVDMDEYVILDDRGERLGAMCVGWALIGEPQFFAFGDTGLKGPQGTVRNSKLAMPQ